MIGLYVHVPFRRAPRPYDDAEYEGISAGAVERFVAAFREEVSVHRSAWLADAHISTLYVGGGRPSLLSVGTLREIRDVLDAAADLSSLDEATVEVNPADATPAYLRGLREMGVTRLSIAALSLSQHGPEPVDTPHTGEASVRAVRAAREVRVETFSVDVLLNSADPSVDDRDDTLRQVVALNVPHVSVLDRSPDGRPEEEERELPLERAMSLLRSAGYEQYGLPHFAQPGHRSAHQERYYAHGSYVGLGPSAESFRWSRSESPNARAVRWSNAASLDTYASMLDQGEAPVAEHRSLDSAALAEEYILLRLQTEEGLDLSVLRERYGVPLRARAGTLLDRLTDADLLHDDADRIRLTPRGRLVTDAITRRILSAT